MRWAVVIAILLFHFARIQGQMNRIKYDGGPMFYNIEILLLGIFILIGYLDEKLFYIKEQGKRVYILKKYEIVPIKMKTIYFAKIRIMVETLTVLLIGAIGMYGLAIVSNRQEWHMSSLKQGSIMSICFTFGLMAVVLIIEGVYQEYKHRK